MSDTKQQNFEVKLTNVRLSFAHIFTAQKPKNDPNGTAKFNCSFLISKETAEGKANIEKMKAAIRAAAKAKWGDNVPKLKPEKFCMRDGDHESYDGYAGHWFVSASNSRRPTIIDRDRTPLTAEDGKPYSGSFCNGIVRVWVQDNEHGKRVNASLEGLQFVRDGEAFGAAPLSEDAFDDLGESQFEDSGSSSSAEEDDEIPF